VNFQRPVKILQLWSWIIKKFRKMLLQMKKMRNIEVYGHIDVVLSGAYCQTTCIKQYKYALLGSSCPSVILIFEKRG
jgi:ethanolamine transporter EutH